MHEGHEGTVAVLTLKDYTFKCWRKGKKVAFSLESEDGNTEMSLTLKQAMDLQHLLGAGIGDLASYSRWHRTEREG